MSILKFITLEVGGVALQENSTVQKYAVTLVYTKTGEINGRATINAGRQLIWDAVAGTEDVVLELTRDNPSQYYNLSDYNFAKKSNRAKIRHRGAIGACFMKGHSIRFEIYHVKKEIAL